jgi:putative ABC transport system substrate-binding protein
MVKGGMSQVSILRGIIPFLFVLFLLCSSAHAADKTVGVIMTGDIPYYQSIHKAFIEEIAGEDVEVVVQSPVPEPVSWANAAKKLVVIGSDIIVAYGAPATLTVMKATSDIPIIFAGVYAPRAMNITGKNATGMSSTVPVRTIINKMKKLRNFARLGVLFNKSEKDTILQARDVKKLERGLGFRTVLFSVRKKVNKAMIKDIDALLLTASCTGMQCIGDVVGIARRDSILTGATIGGGEDIGVIITISASTVEQGRGAAKMVKKVLRGASTSEMPIVEPEVIDTIVNLKEAKSIGVEVPPEVLNSATKVIR